MPKQKIKRTVQELAKEANVDLEESLLLLWDNGFDEIKDQNDILAGSALKQAQRLLKLPLPQEIISTEYWCKKLDIPRNEFHKYLSKLGFECSNNSKRIPRGSLRILKRISQPTQTLIEETRSISKPKIISIKKQVKNNFVWRNIGREAEIEFLTPDDVLNIHNTLVQDFATLDDPISPSGIRCEDLLNSAVFRPRTSMGDVTSVAYKLLEVL